MQRIIVSRCLVGEPVRFDGRAKRLIHPVLAQWREEGRLVPVCPELLGGLSVPRTPAEIVGGSAEDVLKGRARVLTSTGADVTQAFVHGARQVRWLALEQGCRFALLKEVSPSCGVHQVHDGSFGGHLVAGQGLAAALLKAVGVQVFSEHEVDALVRAVAAMENGA